jgi:hypothetical protein
MLLTTRSFGIFIQKQLPFIQKGLPFAQKGLPFGKNRPRLDGGGVVCPAYAAYYKKCLKTAFTVTFSL